MFYLPLLANLYAKENLRVHEARTVSANEITGSSVYKSSSSEAVGFGRQDVGARVFSEVS